MPRRTFPAVLLAVLIAVAPAAQARPNEALEVAKRLLHNSGLAVQLRSFPRQVEQDLAQAQGRLPDELLGALRAAARESFSPAAMQDDLVRAIAARLTVGEMRKALVWLDTDLGRRMTRVEEVASEQLTPEMLQSYAEGLRRRPLSAKRNELIAGLTAATKAVEGTANIIEGVALGIALGMDSMQPVQKRLGMATLSEQLRQQMPPEKIREAIGAVTPVMYAYTYREVSDADLEAYLAFNRSNSGVRYNEAMMGALTEALAKAGLRVGAAIDSALGKKTT
jgi:Uncharacterized protein conserved in bacteria (DUF2059)